MKRFLLLLAFPCACLAGTLIVRGPLASLTPITTDGNWAGTCSSATTCTASSGTQTLTMPGGRAGTLKFTISRNDGTNLQYQLDGGSFTTFTDGATLSLTAAATHTLAIRGTVISSGPGEDDATVIDNDTGTTIGTVVVQNTHA